MAKYLVEFIGTFFLLLSIGFSIVGGSAGNMAPLVIGVTLLAIIVAGARISGAHYNPAVTLAIFLRGKCPAADVIPYGVAQIAGAAAAAGVVLVVKGASTAPPADPDAVKALIAEFLNTFALCYVVLGVATAKLTA